MNSFAKILVTGGALSPYAFSKQSNEAVAALYERIYGMSPIGLRYFNVFGRRQDQQDAYAAIIPKFAMALIRHESPTINGDGSYSLACIDKACKLLGYEPAASVKTGLQEAARWHFENLAGASRATGTAQK